MMWQPVRQVACGAEWLEAWSARRALTSASLAIAAFARASAAACAIAWLICGGPGISDCYYCKECTQQEKDRDGCPKIVNLGSSKTDLFYERKKYGFKKR